MLGHSPLVSFQYTEQTEVWISLSFSSAIIRPIWKVEMITQWSLADTSHWSLRQLSSSIIILAVQIRNIDYPRNSWISPIKAINFEMTVLKTKQFNGIQFGSVRPDFFDYNYIGDTTKPVDAQFISHCAFQSGNRNLLTWNTTNLLRQGSAFFV